MIVRFGVVSVNASAGVVKARADGKCFSMVAVRPGSGSTRATTRAMHATRGFSGRLGSIGRIPSAADDHDLKGHAEHL